MSRERPTEPPKTIPDAALMKAAGAKLGRREAREQRRREELERIKNFSGPGFMGGLMNVMTRGAKASPRFIKRGYEANICDELMAFFTQRPRPWRPARCASKPNRKTLPRQLGRRAMLRRQAMNITLEAKRKEAAGG